MTNIIEAQKKVNKELLEENKNLRQQLVELTNKEQDLKLRIYNAVENVKESENPEIAGTLMTLEQHFLPKDEWVKVQEENGVKKTTFGNEFTLENFVKGCAEWTLLNCNSYDFVSKKNKELEERNAFLEPKVVELTPYKGQVEELKTKLTETLSVWHKEQEEIDDISWNEQIHNWDLGELKELKSRIGEDLNKVIFTVIEKLYQTSKDLAEAINTAEEWKNWQKGLLNDEIKAQTLMLQKADKMLEEEIAKNTKLQEELEEKSKMLVKSEEREEELNRQLYLERKALPALPKKQNTFQKLGSRIKTKFQKLQQLVENKKHQAQEFTAQIEVKVN